MVESHHRLHGVKSDIKVAHVKEDYIKEERHEDFWVLSTDESLSGLQMREACPRERGEWSHQMAYRE
jgi:hypothetical protein